MTKTRAHYRSPCRLRCWCESEDISVFAHVGNVSEGGLFLRTSTPLKRGMTAMVRFGALKEEAQVRVAWVRRDGEDGPVGMGLTFAWPNEHLRNAIRRLIEEDSSPSPQQLSI